MTFCVCVVQDVLATYVETIARLSLTSNMGFLLLFCSDHGMGQTDSTFAYCPHGGGGSI